MLESNEYEVGRRVRTPDGRNYDIEDTTVLGSGNSYLVISDPKGGGKNGVVTLASAARVREEWEARDPEEVAEERQKEHNGADQAEEKQTPAKKSTSRQTPTPAKKK